MSGTLDCELTVQRQNYRITLPPNPSFHLLVTSLVAPTPSLHDPARAYRDCKRISNIEDGVVVQKYLNQLVLVYKG